MLRFLHDPSKRDDVWPAIRSSREAKNGGEEGSRTLDLSNANAAL